MPINSTKGIYTGFHRGENQNPWWVFIVVFRCENRSLNKSEWIPEGHNMSLVE